MLIIINSAAISVRLIVRRETDFTHRFESKPYWLFCMIINTQAKRESVIPFPVLQYNSSKVKGALRCQLWACGPMCIKAFFDKILNFHVSLVPAYLMHLNFSPLGKKQSLAFQYQDEMTTQGANSGEKNPRGTLIHKFL